MLTAVVLALILQQAQPGHVVWSTPAPAPVETPAAPPPPIPDWARADPFGYERSECSPLIRSQVETMEACQSRVRTALAANLGSALPAGLAPSAVNTENCRQVATDDGRYDMRCSTPVRAGQADTAPLERQCQRRRVTLPGGGSSFEEVCEPSRSDEQDGLRFRIGGDGD